MSEYRTVSLVQCRHLDLAFLRQRMAESLDQRSTGRVPVVSLSCVGMPFQVWCQWISSQRGRV